MKLILIFLLLFNAGASASAIFNIIANNLTSNTLLIHYKTHSTSGIAKILRG